jgi:hypothetical protein
VQLLCPTTRRVAEQAVRLAHRGEPDSQAGELALEHREVLIVEVVADQVHAQVPALRALVGAFDLCRDDRRVARPDDARALEPVQHRAHGPL